MFHSPGQKIGAYVVVSPLGAGGMGEVYRARDSRLKRDVAIKVLPADVASDGDRLARFQREAEVLASLNHPHIAQVYGFENPPEGGHHLVMELVDGEDLSLRIARGPILIAEALPLAKQIAEALEAAHDASVVHRDLKPGNIKVRDDGTVKVLDFGLAKASEYGVRRSDDLPTRAISPPAMTHLREGYAGQATEAGLVLGTPAYMSPEQAKGKAVDRRADIWAFGCVLYEMLTGTRAFKGDDVTDIITSVMRDAPDWNALPPATPPGIRILLRRCIEKDPRLRAPHIAIARLAIDDAMTATSQVAATATHPSVPSTRQRLLTILPWAVAGALAIALAVFVPRSPEPTVDVGKVVRFPLLVPDDFLRIATRPASMSLSTDGTRLAFMATDSTNRLGLFVREMSSIDPAVMPLSITNMAWPAWSPDGRYLAVTLLPLGRLAEADISQGGAIRRIDPSGGPAATIAEWGRYQIWGSAGVVVYSGRDGRAYRVPENGGASVAITTLDDASGEVAHLPMSFFPDGRRFIYTVLNRDIEKTATFVGTIDDGSRTPLDVPAWRVAIAGEWLWYLRDGAGTLTAQRIDLSTLRFEGGPVTVAESVANFAVSAAGTLVIVPRDSVQVKMAWLDSHGSPGASVGEPGGYAGLIRPDLSPDGRRMVFLRVDAGRGTPDVWQIDLERNVSTRVVATPFMEDAAVYSSDGKYIVFSSNRNGVADLYRRAADGSGSDELLYASSLRKTPTAISPDGSVLLFTQAGIDTGADIWTLPLDGDRTPKPLVVTPALEGNAQFSPDGRWFAYCAQGAGERDQVIVEPYPPTGARTRISTTEGNSPRWSANGREIYYGTPSGQIMRVPVTTAAGSIKAGAPQNVVLAPQLFSHSAFVLDAQSRILALDPETDQAREPATVILNWPALLNGSSQQ